METERLLEKQPPNVANLAPDIRVTQSKNFGDVAAYFHLAHSFGLIDLLDQAAGKRHQGQSVGLLSVLMAINRCVEPTSKLAFLDWYPQTALPELLSVHGFESQLQYHDLLSSLSYWTDSAVATAENDICQKLALEYGIGFGDLIYDTTSTYFDGEKCELAQKGYSRDHRPDRPQVNFELIVDPQHQFPLWHGAYEGNRVDVDRFSTGISDFQTTHPNLAPTVIIDRGCVSDANLTTLLSLGYHVIAGVPLNKRWAELVRHVHHFTGGFYLSGCHYRFKKRRVTIGDHRLWVIVYYCAKRAKEAAQKRETTLSQCEAELKQLEPKLGKYRLKTKAQIQRKIDQLLADHRVKSYLHAWVVRPKREHGFRIRTRRKKRAIRAAAQLDGKFALMVDSSAPDPKQMLNRYRSKNACESAFSVIKGPIAIRPVFHYSESRVKGHIFICVLALLLRSLFHFQLRKAEIDISVSKATAMLHRQVNLVSVVIHLPSRDTAERLVSHTRLMLTTVDPVCQRIFEAIGLDVSQLEFP